MKSKNFSFLDFLIDKREVLATVFMISFTIAILLIIYAKGKTTSLDPFIMAFFLINLMLSLVLIPLLLLTFFSRKSQPEELRLGAPKSLGLKEVADEREDFIVGQASRRALSFVKRTILPITFIFAILLRGKTGLTLLIFAPALIVGIGQEIIFRRTLKKLKFDPKNMPLVFYNNKTAKEKETTLGEK